MARLRNMPGVSIHPAPTQRNVTTSQQSHTVLLNKSSALNSLLATPSNAFKKPVEHILSAKPAKKYDRAAEQAQTQYVLNGQPLKVVRNVPKKYNVVQKGTNIEIEYIDQMSIAQQEPFPPIHSTKNNNVVNIFNCLILIKFC